MALGRTPGVGGSGGGGGAVDSVNGHTGAVTLTKADVGLSNADNTADSAKPISTAQATAFAAKEDTITAGTAGQYLRGDKSWQALNKNAVGLSNVDNTADSAKPISTAASTALAGKVAKTGDTMTGTLALPAAALTFGGTARVITHTGTATGATVTLTYDGAAVNTSTPNVYVIAAGYSVVFQIHMVGRQQGSDTVAAAVIRGAASRPSSGNARIVGTTQYDAITDAGADTATDFVVSADTTGQYLKIQGIAVTGTWTWTATLLVTEVTG